jgi:hypothetical protein
LAQNVANRDKGTTQAGTQGASQPQYLSVTVVHVKPDAVTEFLAFVRNESNPVMRRGGIRQQEAFVTAMFGDLFEYAFVAPITGFAQFDGQDPIVKALGEEGARSFGEKRRKLVSSVHRYAMRTRPDLSILPTTATPPKLFLVSWITVAPGRAQEFESFIKNDMLPVIKRAQVPGYLVSQVLFGGATNQYVLLTARDSYADLDKGLPWEQVLGREGASKLLQKGAPYIAHVERSIVRFVPELSIMPAVQGEMK